MYPRVVSKPNLDRGPHGDDFRPHNSKVNRV